MSPKTAQKTTTKPVVANPAPAAKPEQSTAPATTEKKARVAAAKFSPMQTVTFNPENYKKEKRGKSKGRIDTFIAASKAGTVKTVADYVDLWKKNNWSSTLAHADLRWDSDPKRNFITIR